MSKPVHINGIGLTTPLGHDVDAFWHALMNAEPRFALIDSFDTAGIGSDAVAGICRDLPIQLLPERKLMKMMTRRDLLALLSALKAWHHAGRKFPEERPEVWGAYTGTNYMRIGDITPYFRPVRECVDGDFQKFSSSEFGSRLQGMINPIMAIHVLLNNGLAQITQALNLRGSNCCYYDFDVAGLRGIVEATKRIRAEDVVGAMCSAAYHPVDAFQYSQAIVTGRQRRVALTDAPTAVTPWSNNEKNSGTILSETGASLLLSNKPGLATVRGVAIRSTHQLDTKGRSKSLLDVMHAALADAGEDADAIQFIVGQGSGCTEDDQIEMNALNELLVKVQKDVPLMSAKPTLGETSEASGVIASIIATLAQTKKCLPPTKNFSAASSKISIRPKISDKAQPITPGVALVYAFNKSGLASAVVLDK